MSRYHWPGGSVGAFWDFWGVSNPGTQRWFENTFDGGVIDYFDDAVGIDAVKSGNRRFNMTPVIYICDGK